ncbi:MAG: CRISPR-associated protein Cas4 [Eubacterium sp.]
MMYDDNNLLNISGIQHFVFCRRQWALIHIEQQWAENLLTVSGEIMHRKAHDNTFSEKRKDIIVSMGMPVSSFEMGITGVCDAVEFHKSDDGAIIKDYDGLYKIVPVEYKYGEPKENDSDILQVAAQAMCLEEMFCTKIDEVNLYYGRTRHRQKIALEDDIRNRVKDITGEMHNYYNRRYTPKVKTGKHCNACSLRDICLPKLNKNRSVSEYIKSMVKENSDEKTS